MKRFPLYLVIFALLLSACNFSLAEDITPPPGSQQMAVSSTQSATVSGPLYPLVPPDPANGQAIYVEKCAPCHGDSGLGDGPRAAQLPNPVAAIGSTALARQSTPEQWYTMVTQGNLDKFMPPFTSLSDGERWDVVAYAFSLSSTSAVLDQGAAIYTEQCARCHGDNGKGDGPDAASISTPPQDLTDQSFTAKKSQTDYFNTVSQGMSPDMPAFSDQLSENERWAVSAYLQTLTLIGNSQPNTEQATAPQAGETPAAGADATPQATAVASASEAVAGVVTGSVTNASGGELPQDLVVTLHGYDDMQEVITQTTTLQADGNFSFNNIDMPTGRVFLATIDYNNTTYGSDISVIDAGMTSINLPVEIYETTTDASIISADRLHMFFEFVDDTHLRVIELFIISNPTNKTLVPTAAGEPTISFKLPDNATNLEFENGAIGDRYVATADGFGDTSSVQPGSSSFQELFAFQLPYDKKVDLVQQMTMPVGAVVILLPEGNLKVKGDSFVDAGTRDVQGTTYRLYNGDALSNGATLQLTISGSPSSGGPALASSSNTNMAIGLGVFGLALVLAGVWLFRRSRMRTEADDDLEEEYLEDLPETTGSESMETLMDAIIALDDLYRGGQLPESAYLARRAELKARLKSIMGD